MTLVIVDAENVRRSRRPNLLREELVARGARWAEREGHELQIVFEATSEAALQSATGRNRSTRTLAASRPTEILGSQGQALRRAEEVLVALHSRRDAVVIGVGEEASSAPRGI